MCVNITQQIHAYSDVYCVCCSALILLITLMLILTTSVHKSTSSIIILIHTYMYMHMHTEPSLTLDTLSSVFDGVQRLFDVGAWLQIPYSKREELEHQTEYDRRQLPRVYSTVFLTENPSPSWSTVAFALWADREHGALEVVQKLYLKGEPCAYSCRSEGRLGRCTCQVSSCYIHVPLLYVKIRHSQHSYMYVLCGFCWKHYVQKF